MAAELTAERLRELLDYDPETGVFVWRVGRRGKGALGSVAGSLGPRGYLRLTVDSQDYRAHRAAWLYVHGRWPAAELDHINGQRDDNRLGNLREATHAENMQNRARHRNNTSGSAGVNWCGRKRRWVARICVDGRRRHLGYFATLEAAAAAYLAAKAELHTFQPTLRAVA